MTHLFDIENRLKDYFPILFDLLDKNSIDWKSVNKTFTTKFEDYQKLQAKRDTPLTIKASFYNIVTAAIKKEVDAIRLLDYIQKLFEELIDILDKDEKALIKDNIFVSKG